MAASGGERSASGPPHRHRRRARHSRSAPAASPSCWWRLRCRRPQRTGIVGPRRSAATQVTMAPAARKRQEGTHGGAGRVPRRPRGRTVMLAAYGFVTRTPPRTKHEGARSLVHRAHCRSARSSSRRRAVLGLARPASSSARGGCRRSSGEIGHPGSGKRAGQGPGTTPLIGNRRAQPGFARPTGSRQCTWNGAKPLLAVRCRGRCGSAEGRPVHCEVITGVQDDRPCSMSAVGAQRL